MEYYVIYFYYIPSKLHDMINEVLFA